jgi:protein-disulfide isomerase
MKKHIKTPADSAPDDHVAGNKQSALVLVEYGDFECPYCGAAHPIIKEIQRTMGENLCFVFRHFPLRTIHPRSGPAAEASEAAAAINAFWPMHDLLFENQENLENEDLLRYGAEVGLDPDQLANDIAQGRFSARVQEDVISGMRHGVNGTPTFFINGVRHNGSFEYEELLSALMQTARG